MLSKKNKMYKIYDVNSNSYIKESNSWRNIQPSARKSIHNNCDRCSNQETMGRHGLGNKRELNLQTRGVDEVDNVMSKMSHPKSPILIPHRNIPRRHSCDISDDPDDDDDSDENILSKSSPPSFPPYSEPCVTASESILERSNRDHSTSSNHINLSRSLYDYETSHNLRPETKSNNCNLFILLAMIFGALGVIYYNYSKDESQDVDIYDKFSFYNDVKDIGERYRVQDNSILKVKTGISTIFDNQDTGSFIFTYDSKASNFNPSKLDQFFEDISEKSSKYLRNDTKQVHYVVVNPSNLIVHTEKEFMNQYQKEVDKWGVMLVKDVDNIPSHLAMAFHYYCDEYNPLVKKSAIFFTLNLAKCSNGSTRKSTHEYVEKCLAGKWNSIEKDKIGPLLTRVVNVIIDVTSIW